MSQFELALRKEAWLNEATARAKRDNKGEFAWLPVVAAITYIMSPTPASAPSSVEDEVIGDSLAPLKNAVAVATGAGGGVITVIRETP